MLSTTIDTRFPRFHPARLFETAAVSTEQMSTLLGLVYQGAMESTPWSSALEFIRRWLDASFVTLVLSAPTNNHRGLIVNASVYGTLLPGEPSYSTDYYALCPFVDIPTDQVLTADQMFGLRGWCSNKFYQQYMKPLDLRYLLAAKIRTDDGVECTFFTTRNHISHDYSSAELAFITLLLPHLRRAINLYSKLDAAQSERTLYAGIIDRMLIGTIVLDESRRVLHSNSAADNLIAGKDGISLINDMLVARCPMENRKLQKAIRLGLANHLVAAVASAEVTMLSRPSGKPPLSILIRPIASNYCSEKGGWLPAVAIFIRDPCGALHTSRDIVRKLFKLTRTETELAMLMMDGLTLNEAANTLGVTKNTVRTHLRGIFAKTGATRQSTLMKTLLNSVVSMELTYSQD